jgi:hypothetical protein
MEAWILLDKKANYIYIAEDNKDADGSVDSIYIEDNKDGDGSMDSVSEGSRLYAPIHEAKN